MLAYSSIEHTGLVCVGLGLGPLGTFAAMLHLLNHTLAKSMMFFLAGRVLHRYRTTEIGAGVGPARGRCHGRAWLFRPACWRWSACRRSACSSRSSRCCGPASRRDGPGSMGLVLAAADGGVRLDHRATLNRMLYGRPRRRAVRARRRVARWSRSALLHGRPRRARPGAARAAPGAAPADRGDRRTDELTSTPLTRGARRGSLPSRVADVRVVTAPELRCSMRAAAVPALASARSARSSAPS